MYEFKTDIMRYKMRDNEILAHAGLIFGIFCFPYYFKYIK